MKTILILRTLGFTLGSVQARDFGRGSTFVFANIYPLKSKRLCTKKPPTALAPGA